MEELDKKLLSVKKKYDRKVGLIIANVGKAPVATAFNIRLLILQEKLERQFVLEATQRASRLEK